MEMKLWIGIFGLVFVLGGLLSYLLLLFVLHRFTYRTWLFDAAVVPGMALAILGRALGGSSPVAWAAVILGGVWFLVSRRELTLRGSRQLKLRKGDHIPAFSLLTIDGRQFTDRDLMARAPALLSLYRGWWCPTSKSQVDEMTRDYESLSRAGLSLFAASVDGPAEAGPLQKKVGDKITILCSLPESLLDEVGVRDSRGAPWYDRFLFGAARQDISMPAWLVIDRSGKILFASRSTRLDQRARPAEILADLKMPPRE